MESLKLPESKSLLNIFTLRKQTLLICFFLTVIRSWQKVFHAHLWAEDGTVFFPDAFEFGYRSIIMPYAGYYQIAPRIFAMVASFFPLPMYAQLITISTIFLFAIVVSKFSEPTYRWIVESDSLRFWTCVAMCGVPGLWEILGNTANVHNILFLYVGLLLLRDRDALMSKSEWAIATITLGSEGGIIVFVPILVLRWFFGVRDESKSVRDDFILFFLICLATCAHASTTQHSVSSGHIEVARPNVFSLGKSILIVISERVVMIPFLGRNGMQEALRRFWVVGLSYILLCLAIYSLTRKQNRQAIFLVLGLATPMMLYVLTWIVRPGSMTLFTHGDGRPGYFFDIRYSFVMAPFSLIFWASVFSTHKGRLLSPKIREYLFIVAILLPFRQQFFLLPPSDLILDWHETASQIEASKKSGYKDTIRLPCHPKGWEVVFRP